MSQKQKIKAKKLTIGLPFNLGALEFENDEIQQKAAWALYVELSTRIAVQPLEQEEGILREALTSLYNVFNITRQILRDAGPEIAQGPQSLGVIAIDVLNKGLRPFLVKWHPILKSYEETKLAEVSTVEHERKWEYAPEFRKELGQVREQMLLYVNALAKIAGVEE
ncbi:MAG: hypothetical protein M5U11_10580 [Anaerolineales bacterium]|jgi:hypothetical protein|nr:hypothetical protein [Anaerolineales bacterium]MDX9936388.1 hypothetical protein [Anaerolineales bacterium]GER80210.1 conserved hypothetical protein [Candidatus Denitrolinea symbiosum]